MCSDDIYCKDCGAPLSENDKSCHKCGSVSKLIKATMSTTIRSSANIERMKAKRKGLKKPLWEYMSRKELWRKEGKIVHRFMDINRVEDKYEEVVTDIETGDIIHECKEPLSEHYGHGSAKKRK